MVDSLNRTETEARTKPAEPPAPVAARNQPAAKRNRRKPRLSTRVLRSPSVQRSIAGLVAGYLRLVNRTSPISFDPPDAYARYVPRAPVIFTMWHGQHFMLPFARIFDFDARVLISRHHDGEINALVAQKLGIRTIRGSTARNPSRMLEKGGMAGFMEMRAALEEGACVTMTADISNLAARRAGKGVVALAKASGRPILPLAYASSRRIDVTSWDRATINLPFSRAVCAIGTPIDVATDADTETLESARRAVEASLNEATERAYRMVDGGNA
ncbi:lysophospholipid acyltransferase family protein [Bauldia sp.]|uniref:lysophospholipid acyltransferase family protein n=1 Tax=Bauldia sp. TaxID=2575872 RepID=UPI003BAABE68